MHILDQFTQEPNTSTGETHKQIVLWLGIQQMILVLAHIIDICLDLRSLWEAFKIMSIQLTFQVECEA